MPCGTKLARRQRLVFFLDEFTYLLQVEPGIAGRLQNLWDHTLSSTELAAWSE